MEKGKRKYGVREANRKRRGWRSEFRVLRTGGVKKKRKGDKRREEAQRLRRLRRRRLKPTK